MHHQRKTSNAKMRSLITAAAAATLSLLIAPASHAGTYVWNDVTGNWSNPANWSGAVLPVSDSTTQLNFAGSGTIGYISTNDMATPPFLLNQLTANSSNTGIGTLASGISGNPLRFTGADPIITQNGSGDFYLRGLVQIAQPTTFTGAGIGNFTLDGTLSGAAGITKTGSSEFRFGSAAIGTPSDNTFSGGITIAGGTLRFNNSSNAGRTALRSNRINITSPSGVLSCISQLRLGELSGVGTVISQDTPGTGDGHDITILGLGDGSFGGTINALPSGLSTIAGKLSFRGFGSQTFSGSMFINNDVSIGRASGITLAGNASIASATGFQVQIHGGTCILDNSVVNNPNRLHDGGTGIENVGGGMFNLIGNTAGTTESIGRLQLGTGTSSRGGGLSIKVTQPLGAVGATVLNIAGYARDSTRNPRDTVNFAGADSAGGTVALGQPGVNPRIVLTGTTPFLQNGLLSRSNLGANNDIGWATVNGSDFATHGGNGIAAVATVVFPAVSTPTVNALLSGAGSITNASDLSVNSLKIQPSGAGQTLSITSTGALSTNAILLAGNQDYSISNAGGTGGISGPGGSRYFQVPIAALTVGVALGTANPITKAGDGFLILTNATNAASPRTATINGGTLRATAGASLPGGLVEFRGGVLELTGGTFSRPLGSGVGAINWRADSTDGGFFAGISNTDKGSGGFSAFGAPVVVDLDGAGPNTYVWEDPYFIDGAHAFLFGSTRANASVTFVDNINFTGAGTPKYDAREFRVIDNPTSTADFARLSGAIIGTVRDDLLKTGDGILELTNANNSFAGGVVVGEGSLLFSDSAALGSASGAYLLLGLRSGGASSALLASNSSGMLVLARSINVQTGSSGNAILGNRRAPDAANVGDALFSGDISLGITGDVSNRALQLTAEPASTVTFSGAIAPVPGYLGTISVEKIGGGTVELYGANSYTGNTTVTSGALRVSSDSNLGASGSAIILNGGTLQTAASLVSPRTISVNAIGGTIDTNGFNSTFSGPIVGAGTLIKTGNGMLRVSNVRSSGLRIDVGTLSVLSNGGNEGTSRVSTFALAGGVVPTATLDLNDNDLLVTSGTYAAISGAIKAARNGGLWNQPGLTSSSAASASPKNKTLGTITGTQFHTAQGAAATFDGFTVANSDVLVKYTYYGDADLNGTVNFDDYSRIDSGFNSGGTDWFHGDFDYNGHVDFDDYSLIDNAFNTQSGTLRRAVSYLDGSDPGTAGMSSPTLQLVMAHFGEFGPPYASGFLNAVPEPTSIATVCAIAVSATMSRRMRRRM